MANENTKYTHRIEKCCPLLRALCYVKLEQYTGETLSRTYWRLQEGKGLLTYQDKANLDAWSKQITSVRRFFSSPLSLSTEQHISLVEKREKVLELMERYRDWLSIGSKPTYVTELTQHDNAEHTLEFAVRRLYEKYSQNNEDSGMTDFWKSLELSDLLDTDKKIWNDLKPIFTKKEEEEKYDWHSAILAKDYLWLPYNKVWQIRADMEHRSSRSACINDTMNWLWHVSDKSEGLEEILETNDITISEFVEWKNEVKEEVKRRKKLGNKFSVEEKEGVFQHLLEELDRIVIPGVKMEEEG